MNGNLELLYVLDFLNCIRESIMTTKKMILRDIDLLAPCFVP